MPPRSQLPVLVRALGHAPSSGHPPPWPLAHTADNSNDDDDDDDISGTRVSFQAAQTPPTLSWDQQVLLRKKLSGKVPAAPQAQAPRPSHSTTGSLVGGDSENKGPGSF